MDDTQKLQEMQAAKIPSIDPDPGADRLALVVELVDQIHPLANALCDAFVDAEVFLKGATDDTIRELNNAIHQIHHCLNRPLWRTSDERDRRRKARKEKGKSDV